VSLLEIAYALAPRKTSIVNLRGAGVRWFVIPSESENLVPENFFADLREIDRVP
jgi:hypothetical protein